MRTKRAIGGALAGLLLLTGTGALGHAWAVAMDGNSQTEQGQTAQAVSLSATAASVVDADQMMEAAGLDGSVPPPEMAGAAFSTAMGPLGPGFAAAAMLLFAWSSVLGWSQYGAECWCYLFGPDTLWAYRLAFLALILPGCTAGFAAVWALADTFNGLMMLPNLIGLFALSGEVAEETRRYLRSRKKTAPPPA